MEKIYKSAQDAVADIPDGASIMCGGFGLCGNPENLIAALHQKGTKRLSLISNNLGTTEHGLGILLKAGQVAKAISSYVGENKEFERQYLEGQIEVELTPQGTLAERIRAGGAGIPAFFTPTGIGTQVEKGDLPMRYGADKSVLKASPPKETRLFEGRLYLLETALTADYAFIRAHAADTLGNLIFSKTARNFNPMMAMAARITIVEAEHIVPAGELDPDKIHVPSAYVKRIVQGQAYSRLIENRTTRPRPASL